MTYEQSSENKYIGNGTVDGLFSLDFGELNRTMREWVKYLYIPSLCSGTAGRLVYT